MTPDDVDPTDTHVANQQARAHAARRQEAMGEFRLATERVTWSAGMAGHAPTSSGFYERPVEVLAKSFQPDIISQADRRFTRAEVLAVLKAKKATITAMANPLTVIAHLIAAFERME